MDFHDGKFSQYRTPHTAHRAPHCGWPPCRVVLPACGLDYALSMVSPSLLIAGAGIGGLAAALACRRAGLRVQVLEQSAVLSEVGAGLQLGPNAVRVLDAWGLGAALRRVACAPKHLQVLAAEDGRQLGSLRLGRVFSQRYGSDYLTLHRADLQQLLLDAALASGAELTLETTLKSIAETADGISATAINGTQFTADALLGCDGLWSHVRQHLLGDGRPLATGHLAYRTLIAAADMPPGLAGKLPLDQVSVWLGPQRHAVAYPVRGGALLNLVVIVHGSAAEDVESWDHAVHAQNLLSRLSGGHRVLQDLIALAPQWKRWVLNDRAPVQGPAQMARGRIALLGDAAHPMRPYLAQGAAMALEDARALGRVLEQMPSQVATASLPQALGRYAEQRWQRNARVQAQSRRNGWIFHADGLLRHGRNLAMASLGERLLDNRWLYAG